MRTRFSLLAAIGVISAGSAIIRAQEPTDVIIHKEVKIAGPGEGGDVLFFRQGAEPGPITMDFIGAEMSFSDQPVKGAPYMADAVTETTQTLADGNHISRKSTSTIYRDSEGRTRREETMAAIGPWAAAGNPPQTIFIHDPVAGSNYVLNPQSHSARKLASAPGFVGLRTAGEPRAGRRIVAQRHGRTTAQAAGAGSGAAKEEDAPAVETFEAAVPKPIRPDVKKESLGKRTIEGVEAEGTRSTITIPAGAIGNELPITSVSERWYSTALQAVVMSQRSDPRFGDTVYRLINIRQGEQPPALFEVPSDYTIQDGPQFRKMMRAPKPAEEAK
ncbi:MAG TPA: hypothetical protein VJN43_14960 [Bryobacteraceae bacterium]|nr:hypothetical protein [Bryobacteraceae bacterium]